MGVELVAGGGIGAVVVVVVDDRFFWRFLMYSWCIICRRVLVVRLGGGVGVEVEVVGVLGGVSMSDGRSAGVDQVSGARGL